MRGLILAAGRGSRMGALTVDAPKCLTRLGSRTLLERQIAALRGGGCTEIGIVTGYRADLLRSFADHEFHNPSWASSNMVHSLTMADEWLCDGPVIVSYSDIFYEDRSITALAGAAGEIAIAFDPDWLSLWSARFEDPLLDAETFRRDETGWLTQIGDRADHLDQIEGQYMGLIRIEPEGWRHIVSLLESLAPADRARIDMTGLIARLLRSGALIGTSPVIGPWGECDTPSDYALYQSWVETGRLPA